MNNNSFGAPDGVTNYEFLQGSTYFAFVGIQYEGTIEEINDHILPILNNKFGKVTHRIDHFQDYDTINYTLTNPDGLLAVTMVHGEKNKKGPKAYKVSLSIENYVPE